MAATLRSLQRNPLLQEKVYQSLRAAILSGELKTGERLVEVQLAATLQVSRTPVREALRLLQHENLVKVNSSGMIHVVTLSEEDAAQLYDCRIALEQQAVIQACQRVTPEQLSELKDMLLQSEKLIKGKQTQLTSFQMLDLDYRFHRLISQCSGNVWLTSLLEQVFDKMQLLRLQTMCHNPRVLDIGIEHYRVYEALVQRNVEAAAQAISDHLKASKERVVREVAQLQLISEQA